jgi:hypothetical protein
VSYGYEDTPYGTVAVFSVILGRRSLTAIERYCEDVLNKVENEVDQACLKAILNERRLDEVYAICHDRLGVYHINEARTLRAFMEKKGLRK